MGKYDKYDKLDKLDKLDKYDRGMGSVAAKPKNLIEMKNELEMIKKEREIYNPNAKNRIYGLFDPLTDGKKHIPNKAFQIHNPTVFAIITAVIYMIIHIIIYKNTTFAAWKIVVIVFVWPILIEFLSRNMKNNLYLSWLLSIGPLIILIGHTIYEFRNAIDKSVDKEEKKDKSKKL